MPYFPAIGQPIAEILRINGFQMVAVRHIGLLKFAILTALGLLCPISVTVSNSMPTGHTVEEAYGRFSIL